MKSIEKIRDPWGGAITYRVKVGKQAQDFYCEIDAKEYLKKLKTTEGKVERILESVPETNTDDWTLYCAYIDEYTDMRAADIRLTDMMIWHKQIPSFKTIERCRRKIHEKRPELKDGATAIKREQAEEVFKEFSKNF